MDQGQEWEGPSNCFELVGQSLQTLDGEAGRDWLCLTNSVVELLQLLLMKNVAVVFMERLFDSHVEGNFAAGEVTLGPGKNQGIVKWVFLRRMCS